MADTVPLTPTADTYLDWANADKNFGSETALSAGVWQEMWTNAVPGLKGYTSKIVLMKFNVKDYVGKITKATLTVTGTNPTTNSNTRSIYLGTFDGTSWEEAKVTASNSGMFTRDAKKLNIHPLNLSVSIPKGKTQECSFSSNDLVEYLNSKADADGNVSLVIYGLGQECSVASKESETKPSLVIEYSASQLYTATFSETSGLSPEVKVYSDEACTTEVSASSLEANTKYYYVASLAGYEDSKGEFTMGSEDTSVSLTMTKKARFNYVVNLVDESGKVLNTVYSNDDAYDGLAVNYSYPKYLTDENGKVTYVCELTSYSGTVMATKGETPTVVYKAYTGTAYFVEGEKAISEKNEESANYSSGTAVRGFDTDKDLFTIPESGIYRLTYAVCNNNTKVTRTLIISADDKEIVNKDVTWSVNYVQSTGTITEDAQAFDKGTVIKAKGSDTNIILDYILLEKLTGDNVAVTSVKYATYVPTCNVVAPADVKVYTAKADVANKVVNLTEITAGSVIPAGTPVLVGAAAGTYTFAASADEPTTIGENELKAATAETKGNGSIYVLVEQNNQAVFAPVKEGVEVPVGKAYMVINAANKAAFYSIGGGNGTTSINNVNAKTADDGVYYTLQGVKVNKPAAKGIYIHNGKKMIK